MKAALVGIVDDAEVDRSAIFVQKPTFAAADDVLRTTRAPRKSVTAQTASAGSGGGCV